MDHEKHAQKARIWLDSQEARRLVMGQLHATLAVYELLKILEERTRHLHTLTSLDGGDNAA